VSQNSVSTVGLMNSIGLGTESHSEARDPVEFFDFFLDKLISILRPTNSGGIIQHLFVGVHIGRRHNDKNWRREPFTS
jgi:hypothetical protein